MIQTCLFNVLRTSHDKVAEDLKHAEKRSQILKRCPEMEYWENPSDQELRALIEQEQCNHDGQEGWSYSVLDEPTCVTGTLEIFVTDYQAKVIGSSWGSLSEHPGFKFSEQVIN